MEHVSSASGDGTTLLLRCLSVAAAVLLWVGLWTPISAVTAAVIQIGIMSLDHLYPSSSVVVGALDLALAMLGPGAWSLDARIFGRKRIM
jgi:putative oxidoreductase